MSKASVRKIFVFSHQLSEAVRQGAALLEMTESSFVRSACIIYLRRQGDDDIDALLDDLKSKAKVKQEAREIGDGMEVNKVDSEE